ncbi:MAG: hypothetical protein LBE25_02685 [Arthrobacter sp.]|jgi:hypothetical protein|nr:hypothetical protein [Arthrobacter sp.]
MIFIIAEQVVDVREGASFDWASLIPTAIVAAIISGLINIFWERRKLSRSEKAAAYSGFLQASSKRWKAFGDRDGAAASGDAELVARLDSQLAEIRDEQWGAYALLQIVGSQATAVYALSLIKAFDERNKNFRNPGTGKNIGADKKSEMQNQFVAAARRDMGLRPLDKEKLKTAFERSPRNK